jgi:IS30 family transposase
MTRAKRAYSAGERRELWERWRGGESISEIGRALDRAPGTIFCTLKERGGFSPADRRRSRLALTLAEREEISRGIAAGESGRAIARSIGRSPATVCREITRHGGRARYRAASAERRAWANAERPQACKLALNGELRDLVAGKLSEDWSPQQIAGWLRLERPEDQTCWISHETIYRTLFIQTRGALRRELLAHLRRAGRLRRARGAKGMNAGQGRIRDAVSIRERPADIEDRAIPGHWEGDLLAGAANTHIATIVERHSRFLMLVRVEGKDTQTVVEALTHHMGALPHQLRLSLTWDRGTELAAHAQFTVATDLKVYFCDPQSPWQRGSNENTNGLLRQYLPKGTDFSQLTQLQLDEIARKLNTRPRETLGFHTPAATLDAALR